MSESSVGWFEEVIVGVVVDLFMLSKTIFFLQRGKLYEVNLN